MGLATITNNILVDSGILTANIPDSSFPSQTGNGGKYLTTNGTALSWAIPTDTGITSLNSLTGTSQTFSTGTSGTDFGISSVGTTHTFNIPTASATNRGLLSTSDWSSFNNKQNAITLTTTGTSGASTFSSNTLNIPQYQSQLTLTTIGSTGVSTLTGNTLNIPNYNNITDGVISGGVVTWSGTGLVFNISSCNYYINGVNYSSAADSKTLATADPTNGRIDVFAVNTSGQVVVITGTPSANPQKPQVDPSTQLELTTVSVSAGSTTPTGVTSNIIYDENVETNWTKTSSLFSSVNYAYTISPYIGTYCIQAVCGATLNGISFTSVQSIDYSSYTTIKFAIKLTRALYGPPYSEYITLRGYTSGNVPIGSQIFLDHTNQYGFNYQSTSWQLITVPLSQINITSGLIYSFLLTVQQNGLNAGFTYQTIYFDRFELQGGINQSPTTSNSFGKVTAGSGTATATIPTDTLNVVASGLASVSASAKTLTISVPLTLTTTGTSGASTLVGNTLNIPQYQSVLTDPVTGTGTSNQIAYWTSSSTIGGLSTTTYPSLTELSYVKGVTSSIQTQIGGKQDTITLTTTGTSGAATLVGSTLNIPQYAASMAIGGSITSATAGSVLFAGASGVLAQDNATFFWDDTNDRLGVNTNAPQTNLHVVTGTWTTTVRGIFSEQLTNDTNGASLAFGKKRVNAAVVNGDAIANIFFHGWDGSTYVNAARFRMAIDGAVSAGVMPTAIQFYTGSSGNGTVRLSISSGGVSTFSGQITSTVANSTTTGGGQIYLNGATGNRIDFNANGVAAPAFTTRSAGTKITLYPAVDGTNVDYAIGIEGSTQWYSIPQAVNTQFFRWYAGTTNIMSLNGIGQMTLSRNQNAATRIEISNTTSGTTSESRIFITSDATAGTISLLKYSGTTTAYKIIAAKDGAIYNATAGGDIAILNDTATGTIKFAAGASSTAQLTIAANGNITQSVNQNGATALTVSNTTSGTASTSQLNITSDASTGTAAFGKYSTTTTAAKIINPKDAFLYNGTIGGDISILNDFATGTIKFAAGGSSTAQAVIKTTGQLQLNNYTSTSSFTGTIAGYLGFDSNGNVLSVAGSTTTFNRQVASYTLALSDAGKLVEMNVGTANNLTVPLNSSIAFPIGTSIDIAQYGAGQTTVVATGGVTIRSVGNALKLYGQYAGATLIKIGTDEWYLFGDLTV